MAASTVSGVTVVPAYRVVAHFVKQAANVAADHPLDSLERKLRHYVRNSLSALHGAYADVGERWTVTQLGDPDLAVLDEALPSEGPGPPRLGRSRPAGR